MRTTCDGKGVVHKGDTTTTGGVVLEGVEGASLFFNDHGSAVALKGHKVFCPACERTGVIAEGSNVLFVGDDGTGVALDGHIVACGCPYGRHRLIAKASSSQALGFSGQSSGVSSSISRVSSESWSSSASLSRSNISSSPSSYSGYYSSYDEYGAVATATSATQSSVKQAPPVAVFAKSCERGEGCTDAGTEPEPDYNFGRMAFYVGATAGVSPTVAGGMANSGGAVALKWIAGRFSSIGTWLMRSSPMGALVMGMMPGTLNSGEDEYLDNLRLQQIATQGGTAPTRVRFRWVRNQSGKLEPVGYHTSAESGQDQVRVRHMVLNEATGVYEFTADGEKTPTVYWNPIGLNIDIPNHTGNTERPDIPNPIMIFPIPEEIEAGLEGYPLPEEQGFEDYILVFPIPDMPPLYIYLSKNPNDPIWTPRKKITEVQNAYKHWKKHGKEFPALKNSKEYIDAVHDFVNNPPEGTLTKKRNNGDELFYHPETNTFASKAKNGAPRTMFKPKDRMDYWRDQ
ncbi:S-type pyocin domain-containing protein [Serratia microhaemolytica]|uniref:S-type pyocin domain-containing protein n=1 Tax=Serratia microhaemolytica TaxID=2675110 RepID=UPI000FDCE4C4|nr:S-type pyocin domain-containing protein [Serratia microhaemolytica]